MLPPKLIVVACFASFAGLCTRAGSRQCGAPGIGSSLPPHTTQTIYRTLSDAASSQLLFLLLSALGNLGNVLTQNGRLTEAENAFKKALEYRSNMADTHYNL